MCLNAKHGWCRSRACTCVWQWSDTAEDWCRQPVPSIKQLANAQRTQGERDCILFPLDWLDIMLITGRGFNDSVLQDQGEMIYYCCSSFTMHFVNVKITVAEKSHSVTRKAQLTPCHVHDSDHLTVRDNRPVTTH